uniref:60S ribosomal protein L35 n=1 Tax=Rhabditophanes sp. KR3021 TaxID=114890 RepID=A0AC35TL71_9BILA
MERTKKQFNKAIGRIICKTGLEQISTNTVIPNAGLKKEASRLKKESEDKSETINEKPDGAFVAVKKNDGTIGTVASEVKQLMIVRLQRLYDSEQLVYEKLG